MSSMLTQTPLNHRPFLPVSRLTLEGGYPFLITWCAAVSAMEGVVWWTAPASPPTYPGYFIVHTPESCKQ